MYASADCVTAAEGTRFEVHGVAAREEEVAAERRASSSHGTVVVPVAAREAREVPPGADGSKGWRVECRRGPALSSASVCVAEVRWCSAEGGVLMRDMALAEETE